MNCDQHKEYRDSFLDEELEQAVLHQFRSHTEWCSDCSAALARKKELRRALKDLPVRQPQSGFYDWVLEETVRSTHRNTTLFWTSAGLGSAIAASLIAWLVLSLPINSAERAQQESLVAVSISLNVEKTVRLSFEATRELPNAMLVLELPAGVEVPGFENSSEISWATDVRPGTNILKLPIVARAGSGGTVVARIEHGGKSKSFEFDVEVI